jgi:transcriptional regulator
MYNFAYYKDKDPEMVRQFMLDHPFITLVGADENGRPVATQLPVMLEEREGKLWLLGHIMKKTDHHLAFEKNRQVLAIFSGPHTYVSASWCTNKQTGSTWNYMSVHARGLMQFADDAALYNLLKRLTAHFENNPDSPSLVEQLSPEYMQGMMKAIVAFEIEVAEMDHVFKLSQNSDETSYDNIIHQLKTGGDTDAAKIAEEMMQRKASLFNQKATQQ